MATTIDPLSLSHFTVDQFKRATGWAVPTGSYGCNLSVALDYFQRTVPRPVLMRPVSGCPWVPKINGVATTLASWLQGIDFHRPVTPNCWIRRGELMIGFKDPSVPVGTVCGNWFTSPHTRQDTVAIHSSQTSAHRFSASSTFTCLQSSVSDAFVGWVDGLPAEYRHGGAQQLFIWDARRVLVPA